jgi:hypothetical protein
MAIAGGVDIGNVRADCRTTRIKARALHDNSSRRLERLEGLFRDLASSRP